jgi:hypothetical protein
MAEVLVVFLTILRVAVALGFAGYLVIFLGKTEVVKRVERP